MTDHLWTQEQIAAFLADGLDAIERERFQTHVRDCAECFTAVEAARAFDRGLANLFASVRPGPTFEDRTVRALRTPTTPSGSKPRVWGRRLMYGLAASLAIGALGALSSLVIANGGLPMPGESFAWGQRGTPDTTASPETQNANADDLATRYLNRNLDGIWFKTTNNRHGDVSALAVDADKMWDQPPALDFTTHGTVPSRSTAAIDQFGTLFGDQKGQLRESGQQKSNGGMPIPSDPNPASNNTSSFSYYSLSQAPTESDGRVLLGAITAGVDPQNASPPPAGNMPTGGPMSGGGGAVRGYGFGVPGMPPTSAWSTIPAIGTPGVPPDRSGTTATGKKVLSDNYFSPPAAKDSGIVTTPTADFVGNRSKLGIFPKTEASDLRGESKNRAGLPSDSGEPKPTTPAEGARGAQPVANPPVATGQPAVRKIIIRSGDIEFEVESFDSSVATITLLVTKIQGAYIGTVNSEKLANGKVKGSIIVRVPPESLDGLVLELRKELGKTGELKGQKIGSQDITKMYTDFESRLKAARAMEARLLEIIKTGKGEIKQLLEAEKELGVWRTKIEEYEGELRYYGNLAALSTLTITLAEKEIRTAAGITESERVQAGVEVEDVDKAFRDAMAAVLEAKGRVTKSELKQLSAGQFNALLNFEIAPDASGPLRDRLKQFGRVARLEIDRVQKADGGPPAKEAKVTRGDTVFQVQFYNLANVAPRETAVWQLAVPDVAASYRTLRDAVEKAKGRVVTASVSEGEKINVTAQFDFEVKRSEEAAILAAFAAAGDTVSKTVSRAPENDTVTDTKILFRAALFDAAKLQARETTLLQLAVTDIPAAFAALRDEVEKAKGRIVTAQLNDGTPNALTQLDFELKRGTEAAVLAKLATAGETITRTVTKAVESASTTDSKLLIRLTFLETAKLQPRETTVIQYAVTDIPAGFRSIRETVEKANGRIVNSQLNENDRQNVTAQLDFELKRGEEAAVFAALNTAGDILGRQTTRQAESRLVSDSKSLIRLTFANASRLNPRETTTLAVEVPDVDAAAAVLGALVNDAKGRVVDSNVANDRAGRVTAKLVYDVPFAAASGIAEKAKAAGTVRVQQSTRDPSATDGKYATARLDIVLSNTDLIVPKDDGVWPQVRKGLSYSASALLSSLSWVIFGLCVVLPWMVVGYIGYRLIRRATKKPAVETVPVTAAG